MWEKIIFVSFKLLFETVDKYNLRQSDGDQGIRKVSDGEIQVVKNDRGGLRFCLFGAV